MEEAGAAMREIQPQRAVSSRALARTTARLLDEIDETGSAIGMVRFGRIVAVLMPFEEPSAQPMIYRDELSSADREIFC